MITKKFMWFDFFFITSGLTFRVERFLHVFWDGDAPSKNGSPRVGGVFFSPCMDNVNEQ